MIFETIRRSRLLVTALAVAALAIPAEAYYHYVYFSSRGGPFSPIYGRFDVTKLIDSTVVFCVNGSGPAAYFPNDSFPSVIAEIEQAAAAWNAVPNSAMHVAFGGLEYNGQNQNTPGGDVVFQDLGPGLLGLGSPNLPATPQFATVNGVTFVPISRSTVILTDNTSIQPGPSYLEMFFTTAVHEFGHALGLQHTWTASAMSQDVIRNTSRSRPLDADDIASFSELYGVQGWANNYGTISGRVAYSNGSPVSMASVVAIPLVGPAVSTLTNPDGSYTIHGLPPNNYLIYVHPLPPDAIASNGSGLLLAADSNGLPFQPSGSFRTVFYPNTLDPSQATSVGLNPGSNMSGYNFTVQANSGPPAYDFLVYSFPDTGTHNYTYNAAAINPQMVTPAFLNVTNGASLFAVQANPPASTPVPQSISILGVGTADSCALANVFPCFLSYGSPTELAGYFNLSPSMGIGPRHLVFNFGNDLYVVPDGLNFVQQGPPYTTSVVANGDGTATVVGGNFGPDSRVFFDGLQAFTISQNSGSIAVNPPPGTNGQTSTITVFNADAQNSMQFYLAPQDAPIYQYGQVAVPQIASVNPLGLPAGLSGAPATGFVDITATNGNFVPGQVTVGVGTTDVTVTGVWVLAPNHLLVNISVAPGAVLGTTELSVISGFQVMTAPFQILPPNGVLPLVSGVLSADSYLPTVVRGGYGAVYGQNLQMGSAGTVALNGQPLTVTFTSGSQINFVVPAGVPTGPTPLTVSNGSGSITLILPIGDPPPAIQSVSSTQGTTVDAQHAANVGDVLSVYVTGFNPNALPALSRLGVTISGLPMTIVSIAPAVNGQSQIQFVLGQSFAGSQVPLAVWLDGSSSNPYTITAH
ncbi:MAG TPA: matrixin family metalloprotease [Verrucomicrobiae bacterium]|nr:matrixin family metalloprotease [Verrucomicrobiae bacterium]